MLLNALQADLGCGERGLAPPCEQPSPSNTRDGGGGGVLCSTSHPLLVAEVGLQTHFRERQRKSKGQGTRKQMVMVMMGQAAGCSRVPTWSLEGLQLLLNNEVDWRHPPLPPPSLSKRRGCLKASGVSLSPCQMIFL